MKSARTRSLSGPWMGRAALTFVLVTLVALVIVPLLVQQRVAALRNDIVNAEPARTLVIQLQFNLVREMAALGELLLSGDAEYARTYAQALAEERTRFRELHQVAESLGPEILRQTARAEALANEWHRRVAATEIVERSRSGDPIDDVPRESPLLEAALGATAAIDEAIIAASAHNREQIAAAERLGLQVTILLAVLALIAAGAVAALDARLRRFADESNAQREEAEGALAETARVNDARAQLIRGITHDVKNPLGAARGYAELLSLGAKGPVHPDQVPLLRGIERSVNSALAIITDLLDVARADSGGLLVRWAPCDVTAVVHESVEQHHGAAATAGLELTIAGGDVPHVIHSDASRVQQVLGNLLSNAIKYTPPPGSVTVAIESTTATVSIHVSDTGPGVPASMRESIFDEFTRLHDGTPLKGHGLGLAIARRVARLLGGDVTAGDAATGGALFTLSLPTDRRAPVGAPASERDQHLRR
ncbi:MAG: HAMP domain-containing histidine kinase [Gemmatimonadaceae bacterium]|nr:HAMP domain-containing histidine kinase [Gemmatimonadaceae bacterium]